MSSSAPGSSGSLLASSSSKRGFRTLVMGLVVLGAYVAYRGGRGRDSAEDFDKSSSTRHLVDIRARVDKAALKKWLEANGGVDGSGAAAAAAEVDTAMGIDDE